MANFNSIGSVVSEPQVAENRYLHVDWRYRPYNSVRTNVLHCDYRLHTVIRGVVFCNISPYLYHI